ncbi:hypothetical protein DENSPDRAFT_164552 [Dentipellis sp. KUC8613]|nr:hypothetical protein DENSPDRAFT_164552 [Dentipellis sp. KUC8613]
MQPHRYVGTNAFPDVDFYRGQSSSRSPSRVQNTNAYQQNPYRVNNIDSGIAGSAIYAPVPTLYNSTAISRSRGQTASVTPEPWEAATSEFQVPAYQHEKPVFHYESQFSVNSVHDSLRDAGPWVYNPDDERDTRVPAKRRSSQAASGNDEGIGGVSANFIHADGCITSKNRTTHPRTAEQKKKMAKSAANRRATDKEHLSIIKERLPQLAYGQEYNNRTALAGGTYTILSSRRWRQRLIFGSAIARFDRDEETICNLDHRCRSNERRLEDVERQLEAQKESATIERNDLLAQQASMRTAFEASETSLQSQLAVSEARLQLKTAQYNNVCAAWQRSETELRYYKGMLSQ